MQTRKELRRFIVFFTSVAVFDSSPLNHQFVVPPETCHFLEFSPSFAFQFNCYNSSQKFSFIKTAPISSFAIECRKVISDSPHKDPSRPEALPSVSARELHPSSW